MYIKIRAFPNAKKESIEEKGDELVVKVREPAERNMANIRILDLVAAHFKVARNKVKILTGHRSSGKMLSIEENPQNKG